MNKKVTLTNNYEMPSLALGTWLIPNKNASFCVKEALNIGYRHIDTAQAYENEEGVGLGLKEAGLKREEVFVTSKIAAEIKTYEEAKTSIEDSLKRLNTPYIDLMLIHCVQPWRDWVQKNPYRFDTENLHVWKAMEEVYRVGKIKAIGVSNFNERDIQNIIDHAEIKPMVNQICIHIGQTPIELIRWCQSQGIIVEAYSPIAHGKALNNKVIQEMAEKYHVSVPQLCIQYTLQLGCVSLPKASTREHMIDNSHLDFTISETDLETLIHLKD